MKRSVFGSVVVVAVAIQALVAVAFTVLLFWLVYEAICWLSRN